MDIRKFTIFNILSTDIKEHFEMMKKFEAIENWVEASNYSIKLNLL
jgi:hypothetical protein